MTNPAYARTYSAWFSEYERARKALHKPRGARVPDLPPPKSPDDIAETVAAIGRRQVLDLLQIHRIALHRWLTGQSGHSPGRLAAL